VAIWNVLPIYGIFYDHLVIVFVWYIFSSFGIRHREKSGNPGRILLSAIISRPSAQKALCEGSLQQRASLKMQLNALEKKHLSAFTRVARFLFVQHTKTQ
jgi:hypothetical protein